jgi:hypothetical protein
LRENRGPGESELRAMLPRGMRGDLDGVDPPPPPNDDKYAHSVSRFAKSYLAEARLAAHYLAGYAGRDLGDARRSAGLHRYEVAQGFQPDKILC